MVKECDLDDLPGKLKMGARGTRPSDRSKTDYIVLECFRSPAGANVLSKHIAMLRMNRRPESFISEGRVPRAPNFSLSCIMPR